MNSFNPLKNIYLFGNFIFYFGLVGIILISIFSIDNVGGDASIYFSYSKHFWSIPYSLRENGMPEYGATGPLWVIYLSLFGSNYKLLKLFNVILIIISFFLLKKTDKNFIFLPLLILITPTFPFMNALVYEVSILFFLFTLLWRQINLDYPSLKIVAFILGLMITVRPESILLIILLYDNKIKWNEYITLILIIFFPYLIYLVYMYIMTGNALPSSILERIMRHVGGDNGSERIFSGFYNEIKIAAKKLLTNLDKNINYFGASAFALFLGIKKPFFLRISIIIFLFTLIFTFSDSPRWRYFLLLDILTAIVICQILINFLINCSQKIEFNIRFLCVITAIGIMFYSPFFLKSKLFFFDQSLGENKKSTFIIRFAPDLDLALNSIGALSQDRILIYEFGSQYSSSREFISVDGIISNFPIKFDSIKDFENSAKIAKYYVSSHGCGRKKFKNSFIEKICIEEKKPNTLQNLIIDTGNIKLKRIYTNPHKTTSWNAIYLIES